MRMQKKWIEHTLEVMRLDFLDLCVDVKVVPAVNQMEIHPFCQQNEAMEFMGEFNVKMQAWGPFARDRKTFSSQKCCQEIPMLRYLEK